MPRRPGQRTDNKAERMLMILQRDPLRVVPHAEIAASLWPSERLSKKQIWQRVGCWAAVLREQGHPVRNHYNFGFSLEAPEIQNKNQTDKLGCLLRENMGRVISRDEIYDTLWPDPDTQPENAYNIVSQCLTRLRMIGMKITSFYGRGVCCTEEPGQKPDLTRTQEIVLQSLVERGDRGAHWTYLLQCIEQEVGIRPTQRSLVSQISKLRAKIDAETKIVNVDGCYIYRISRDE